MFRIKRKSRSQKVKQTKEKQVSEAVRGDSMVTDRRHTGGMKDKREGGFLNSE